MSANQFPGGSPFKCLAPECLTKQPVTSVKGFQTRFERSQRAGRPCPFAPTELCIHDRGTQERLKWNGAPSPCFSSFCGTKRHSECKVKTARIRAPFQTSNKRTNRTDSVESPTMSTTLNPGCPSPQIGLSRYLKDPTKWLASFSRKAPKKQNRQNAHRHLQQLTQGALQAADVLLLTEPLYKNPSEHYHNPPTPFSKGWEGFVFVLVLVMIVSITDVE